MLQFRIWVKRICVLALWSGAMANAHAASWTVGGAAPQFATVQAAIDSAMVQAGDTLNVRAGVYGAVNLPAGKPLIIQGVAGSPTVVIESTGAAPAGRFAAAATCRNVQFRRTTVGPALLLDGAGAGATFENNIIGPSAGHGLELTGGGTTVTLTRCSFINIAPDYFAIRGGPVANSYDVRESVFGSALSRVAAISAGTGANGARFKFTRCEFKPVPAGRSLIVAQEAGGATFHFENCVIVSDDAGFGHVIRTFDRAHTWRFVHCTMTETAGQAYRQFLYLGHQISGVGDAANGSYQFSNCIFNWPASTSAWILSVQGAPQLIPESAIDAGTVMFNIGPGSLDPNADALSGKIAERIDADPLVKSDGYHLNTTSPARGRARATSPAVDIDGETRPGPAATIADLGCDEETTTVPPEIPDLPLPPMTTIDQVWQSFDPRADPLEVQVLATWNESGSAYIEFYFTGETWLNEKVRVYAIYSAPIGQTNLPAMLHIHGGGQTADAGWLSFWNARGYAAMTFDFCGDWAGRTKFTQYGALTQGNQATPNYYDSTNPNQRSNSWYHWALLARRCLTYLESRPEVDDTRLGIFGISIGGSLTWMVAGTDARVKAACAIYGAGWNTYPTDTAAADPYAGNTNMAFWRTTLDPAAYAPRVTAPLLFLNATNDQHGLMDYAQRTLDAVPAGTPLRQSYTPRTRHTIEPEEGRMLPLWMDRWLKAGAALPAEPQGSFGYDAADREATFSVTPDLSQTVTRVEIYYAVENTVPISRYWRPVAAVQQGGTWRAKLSLLRPDRPLYAFANVHYASGAVLSTDWKQATPSVLGDVAATEGPSKIISDFGQGLDAAGWLRMTSYTDPNIERSYVQAATGPGGVPALGFVPAVGANIQATTLKLGDPKWRGRPGAVLRFKVQTAQANNLQIDAITDDFVIGSQRYVAVVPLAASAAWQELALTPADFKLNGTGPQTLANWERVNKVDLYRESPTQAPTAWVGPLPLFADFRWELETQARPAWVAYE